MHAARGHRGGQLPRGSLCGTSTGSGWIRTAAVHSEWVESEVEGTEHQDDPDVGHEPRPDVVSEEQQVDTVHGDDQRDYPDDHAGRPSPHGWAPSAVRRPSTWFTVGKPDIAMSMRARGVRPERVGSRRTGRGSEVD